MLAFLHASPMCSLKSMFLSRCTPSSLLLFEGVIVCPSWQRVTSSWLAVGPLGFFCSNFGISRGWPIGSLCVPCEFFCSNLLTIVHGSCVPCSAIHHKVWPLHVNGHVVLGDVPEHWPECASLRAASSHFLPRAGYSTKLHSVWPLAEEWAHKAKRFVAQAVRLKFLDCQGRT